MVLRLPDSWSNWNLEMLVFEGRGKPEYPGEKPLGAKERTKNKLNPHVASTPGFEPGHSGEKQALSPLRHLLLLKSCLRQNNANRKGYSKPLRRRNIENKLLENIQPTEFRTKPMKKDNNDYSGSYRIM